MWLCQKIEQRRKAGNQNVHDRSNLLNNCKNDAFISKYYWLRVLKVDYVTNGKTVPNE
jgi:hypothetical protein